jgi:energy-coupling factor transport system permease protein
MNGLLLIISGTLLILGGLWYLGRESPRTAYHSPGWGWQDWLTVLVSMGVLAICTLPIPGLSHETLYYDPYPTLTLPPFSLLLGMAMLGLLLPGILAHYKSTNEKNDVKARRKASHSRTEV